MIRRPPRSPLFPSPPLSRPPPPWPAIDQPPSRPSGDQPSAWPSAGQADGWSPDGRDGGRSEEHTSELQSRLPLRCRPLLEKKKKNRPGKSDLMSNRLI